MQPHEVAADVLPEAVLKSIRARAAVYDAETAFFDADLNELAELGYLGLASPANDGGRNLSLRELAAVQCRLATAAPATALGLNMHTVWNAVARILADRGDDSLRKVLRESAAGEIYAFGVSEPGNDLMLFDSLTTATPADDGSVRYTGTKIFTSLSPVWTRLGVHGKDEASEQLIWGFIDRADGGTSAAEDWDTLGMRATQSHTTTLDGALVRPERVLRKLPVGPQPDPLLFGIFAAFEILISAIYVGIAERAIQLAVEAARIKMSRAAGTTLDQNPDIRIQLAEAQIAFDGVATEVDALARDVDELVDHGEQWFGKLSALKVRTVRAAKQIVDTAMQVSGGASYQYDAELARLYRDVAAGAFNPSSESSARGTVARALLGPLEV